MSNRYSAYEARRLINKYIDDINMCIGEIQRNFDDMDFENADAKEEARAIINNMKAEYSRLINELSSYSFS